MKFKLLLLSLLCSCFSYAQVQDLAKLADGKMVFSNTLFDSHNKLYGYFFIYERDADKVNKKMEYVLLDKNLNKVNNGEFSDVVLPFDLYSYYYDCTLMGDYLILDKVYKRFKQFSNNYYEFLVNSYQIISLKDNSVSAEFRYENGSFLELTKDVKVLKNMNKKLETKNMVDAFSSDNQKGFIITQFNKNNKDYLEKEIKFFNEKKELQWTYEYNPNGTKKEFVTFHFLHVKNNNIYVAESKIKNSHCTEYKIANIDFTTGKKKYEYLFENDSSKYRHSFVLKEVGSKLIITGVYVPYKKNGFYDYKKNVGFFKIVLDENGKEIEKTYNKWTDFTGTVNVNKKGFDKRKFKLLDKKFFFFEDGSISILTEKYKPEVPGVNIPIPLLNIAIYLATYRSEKTSDFILFNFDKQFALNKVDTIKKNFTKANSSDYLFSQYIKNDTGAVFFYQNKVKDEKTKKESVILGINTLINGQLTEEKIPIFSEKKYEIQPMPAKEGYIMLREFNEKDKYNQVRLEKLNY
jgi:hypothetical protein